MPVWISMAPWILPEVSSPTRLFIASTPMMALACAGAALAHGGRCELVLIGDFPGVRRLHALLAGWRDLPFQALHRLPGRHLEQRAARRGRGRLACKQRLRRHTLPALRRLDARLQPDEVWLGNDRKPETQLALHLASRRLGRPAGQYLDDGLYSYLGDVRRRPLSRRIDTLAKRLAYGAWWQRAGQAGGSRWMARHWLALPGQGNAYPMASRQPLPRGWYDNRAMRRLALMALAQFGLSRRLLQTLDAILILPCSDRCADPGPWQRRVREILRSVHRPGCRLAVKYHPRQSRTDLAGIDLAGIDIGGITLLPPLLPLELLLPVLPAGVQLLGEGTSALLGAHWLRPELAVAVLAVADESADRSGQEPGDAAIAKAGSVAGRATRPETPGERYSRRAAELFRGQGIGRFPALPRQQAGHPATAREPTATATASLSGSRRAG